MAKKDLKAVLLLSFVGSLVGLASVVLPPLIFKFNTSAGPLYGHPLFPWFERALQADGVFYGAFVCLGGIALGCWSPRHWCHLSVAAIAFPATLHGIDLVHDLMIDPTSHNLWPFEYLALAVISAPALLGAFLGAKARGAVRRS